MKQGAREWGGRSRDFSGFFWIFKFIFFYFKSHLSNGAVKHVSCLLARPFLFFVISVYTFLFFFCRFFSSLFSLLFLVFIARAFVFLLYAPLAKDMASGVEQGAFVITF